MTCNPDHSTDEFESYAVEHQRIGVAILRGKNATDAGTLFQSCGMSYVFSSYDNWDGGTYVYDVHLNVDATRLSSYSDEILRDIRETLDQIIKPIDRTWLGELLLVPTMPSNVSINNQARNPTQGIAGINRHNMQFRSPAELEMFVALTEVQKSLPRADTILIVPLPSVWTGRNRWEPDFIITYRGRAGIIEIDDPTHHGRWAADKSRDQVFEECGISLLRRITIEDAADPAERTEFITRFLERLASR